MGNYPRWSPGALSCHSGGCSFFNNLHLYATPPSCLEIFTLRLSRRRFTYSLQSKDIIAHGGSPSLMISHDDSHDDQGKRERSGASAKRSDRGCAVCRRRRVKCDEQKPACASCIRLGLSCSWSSPWKFVELNDNVGKKYDVISTPPRNHSLHTRISDSWQRLEYVPEIKLCVRQHDEEAKSEDGPSSRYVMRN